MPETMKNPIRLTSVEVTSLCDTAASAWMHAPKEREIRFFWRHKQYKSRRDPSRLLVETIDGDPIVCRYE
jgi:hypothetical protein